MSSRSGRDSTCASKPWLLVRWSAVLQFNVVLKVLAADRGGRYRRAVHPALPSRTACRCENQRTDVQVEMRENDWGDPPGLQVVQREHQKCGSVAKRRRDALIEVIECLDGDTRQHGQRTALGEPQNFGHGVCAYEEFFKERVDDHPGHGADGYPEAREGVDYLLRVSPSSAARGVPPPDGQVTDRERQHAEKKDAHRPERITSDDRRSEIGKRPPLPVRSEEHTSELQSQSNLVCRLLLEKKKIN